MEINLVSSINNLNKQVKKDYFNVVIGGNYELNKRILETKHVNLLLDPEPLEKDFMNYKNSGLNQVLVKLAKSKNIGIGFSLSRLLKLNKLDRARLLGKIMQNIILCNKYKVKIFILSNNINHNDLEAFGLTLNAKNIYII